MKSHVRRLAALPEVYKDPFDRILVAKALAERPYARHEGCAAYPLRRNRGLGLKKCRERGTRDSELLGSADLLQ